jgi:hypothetical protein
MKVNRSLIGKLVLGVFCLFLVVAVLTWFVYRPWALNWGATDEEIDRAMAGDEIVASANFNATRAVTVDAPPKEIWPWLVQMGYLKAGFYSWDELDNDGVPSAERIISEYQGLAVGDSLPLSDHVSAHVAVMNPNESMLWVIEHGEVWTWAWWLYPRNEQETRLVTRLRVQFDSFRPRVFADLGEIIMMRKCMLGIKRRAEFATSP